MTAPHVVFVDSTLAGLSSFKTARDMGCRVTFVEPLDASFLALSTADRSRIDPHVAHVDAHVRVPTLSDGTLIRVLREIARGQAISAVVTTSEAAILPVAEAARALDLLGPELEALERAVFKDRCRHALAQAELCTPAFEVLTQEQIVAGRARSLRTPLVVKPTRGFGKQFSAVCRTEAEWNAFVESLAAARRDTDPMINRIVSSHYILEEYVTGSLHSAEVVVVEGEVRFFATTTRYRSRHSDLLEMGYTMTAGLGGDRQEAMERYVREVFCAIGIRFGLYHVELIDASAGPCLVEINGRMMGGAGPQAYQSLSGQDAFELLIRLHLGERPVPELCAIRGAATVVLIGAMNAGTVSPFFTPQRLEALLRRHGITFCTLQLHAGMPVRKFEGNLSVLGHVIVPSADAVSSALKGHAFLLELDDLLGFEVAKYDPSVYPGRVA